MKDYYIIIIIIGCVTTLGRWITAIRLESLDLDGQYLPQYIRRPQQGRLLNDVSSLLIYSQYRQPVF